MHPLSVETNRVVHGARDVEGHHGGPDPFGHLDEGGLEGLGQLERREAEVEEAQLGEL